MEEKKIVDDYYKKAQSEDKKKEQEIKKPKLKIKRKIKIKKIKVEGEEVKIEEKTQEIKPINKKIGSINVIKVEDNTINKDIKEEKKEDKIIQEKKSFHVFKKEDKIKETKNIEKPINKIPLKEEKPNFKKEDFVKKDNNLNNFFSKSNNEKRNDFKKKGKNFKDDYSEKGKKNFKKNHNKKWNNKEESNEFEFSFPRYNKLQKEKKLEKNVEDIKQNLKDHSGETIVISNLLSIKELSEKIGVPLINIITEFMKNGMKVTINSKIDFDTASIISDAFNIKLKKDSSSGFQVEDMISGDITSLIKEDDKTLLKKRPPVISIMGHVDHGKTSLLDYIRKTKVVEKEAGGITQSIGAYQVNYKGELLTFLDTPGHEAFTIMRARGAKSTDIAILVVAADEGVKPQTIESINHAKEAGIQIIVAINKMDKEGANPENVKSQLAQQGLTPEEWGGTTPMVPVSAKTGQGLDDLFEIIVLSSELLDLKANSDRKAVGTILESHLDIKLGPVSTVLINTGTLKKGDAIVSKGSYGKIKTLKDHYGKNIESAGPSVPVLVVGLDNVGEGGDILQVVSSMERARKRALEYKELILSKTAVSVSSIDMIMSKIKSGSLKQLKILVKADTNGSLEALKGVLLKLSTPETKINIIHSGVGNISESDVLMCQGSSAILIGYNISLLGNTKNIIENTKIEYISSKVIYNISERIEKIVTGMLDPKEVEIVLGEATVEGIFYNGNGFMIIGLKLNNASKIEKGVNVRIIRKNKFINSGKIENLKSGIVDVTKLEGPIDCGIKLKSSSIVELGDILEIYKTEIQK